MNHQLQQFLQRSNVKLFTFFFSFYVSNEEKEIMLIITEAVQNL